MKEIISVALAIGAVFFFSNTNANELILASAKGKASSATSLDIVSDGTATALQVRLDVGKGLKVDLSKCVASLPSTHTGVCGYKNGRVTILVHSDHNDLLPVGLVSIGSISASGAAAKSLSIAELLAFDRSGKEIAIKSVLEKDTVDDRIVK